MVYVDESGDRGWSKHSSPVFILSAVIVKAALDSSLRVNLDLINKRLRRPITSELHWSENLRDHRHRKFVAQQISELPVTLTSVVTCKPSLKVSGTALDSESLYRYSVRRLLERVSWAVDRQQGIADLRFAHVRRFKYDTLHQYLDRLRYDAECKIAWEALKNGTRPKIEQPAQLRGLQVADAVGGTVYAAVRPDDFGNSESAYLKAVAPKIWRGPTNKLATYGLASICAKGHDCTTHYPWFNEIKSVRGLTY